MREPPPPQLVALLERLGLATAARVGRMSWRVRRLARGLPRFESVWVDALAQARILTRFQAAEIRAGRGEALRIGSYVLHDRLPWPDYAVSYRARQIESGRPVRLLMLDSPGKRAGAILGRLKTLAASTGRVQSAQIAPITDAGVDGDRIYAASPWIEGHAADRWTVHNGRLPPQVVLEIARQMLAGLTALEKAGRCHGDVCLAGLILTRGGNVVLMQPGIRAILRPEEGYAHADLQPEAYDYLAPERVTDGTPPSTVADVYACGCVWWHLLCGRPPLGGGDSLAKLRAAQAAEVFDVRQLAPDAPDVLSTVISACLQRDPARRPESMVRLAATLGSPGRNGRLALARCLAQRGRPAAHWPATVPTRRTSARKRSRSTAAVLCLAIAAVAAWPIWRNWRNWQEGLSPNGIGAAQHTAADSAAESAADNIADGTSDTGPAEKDARLHGNSAGNRPVVPASYVEQTPQRTAAATPAELVLVGDGPLEIDSLELQAGQCVRAPPGKRQVVAAPRAGLLVDKENVRFENIDFVYRAVDRQQGEPPPAIVQVCASRAEFHNCVFRSAGPCSLPPVAVRWIHPAADGDDPHLALPSGRLKLSDCVLDRIEAGIECRTVGALAVELNNTLHLGSGPLVRLDHCPAADEPVRIALAQVTLRDSGPALECRFREPVEQPGEISIDARRCVFVPRFTESLILLAGDSPPEQLLGNMRWSGQGSLVAPGVMIAAWQQGDGDRRQLDDTSVPMAGMVRSKVGFAAAPSCDPADSRVVRWRAPLQSTDPPGIFDR